MTTPLLFLAREGMRGVDPEIDDFDIFLPLASFGFSELKKGVEYTSAHKAANLTKKDFFYEHGSLMSFIESAEDKMKGVSAKSSQQSNLGHISRVAKRSAERISL